MFEGLWVCVRQLPVMINIIPFTSLLFLIGFVCCIKKQDKLAFVFFTTFGVST
jgi:hypothetical protein